MEPGRREGAVLTIRTVALTGSTNADMLELARAGAEEGLWLRAERQTGGRGRQGRVWESPAGNFYGSVLVRLRAGDPAAATLALVAAVAVDEALSTHRHPREAGDPASPQAVMRRAQELGSRLRGNGEVRIKWPNDLLIDGAKVAGILLERAEDAVVVGVGVNLAHHPDLPDRPTASLNGIVSPEAFAETLAGTFARWLGRWRGEGLTPVRQRWLDRAHPPGTALRARLPDTAVVDGLFDGLDSDGALILRLASGERRVIHAGDVFLI